MSLTVLDLFSGIGGISYGLESTGGFETVGFCEVEPFCQAVLRKHWPEVPIHDDVRRLSVESLGGIRPDVIAGGFPCQPHSVAGKRKGGEDERHLWPEFARLVRELRPRWVLGENVPGIRSTAADEVLVDLEAAGYSCWPLVVGADDVGAPHRRKRVWFIATSRLGERALVYSNGERLAQRPQQEDERAAIREEGAPASAPSAVSRWPARPGEPQHDWEEPRLRSGWTPGELDDAMRCGRERVDGRIRAAESSSDRQDDRIPTSSGARSLKLPLGTPAHGLPLDLVRLARRANREALKAAGNSVCPQVVQAIGRAILAAEAELSR